jgi:hypothetical protein
MPSSPPLEPQGQVAFPPTLEIEFIAYLEGIANHGIFSQAKKASYKKWLENPYSQLKGNTIEECTTNVNHRNHALRRF